MLTSLALIFLVGLALGAACQKTKAAANHRNACHGYYFGAVCV